MDKKNELLTVKEVSKILKVSEQTIRKLIKEEQIRYVKVGKSYRIPKSVINSLIN